MLGDIAEHAQFVLRWSNPFLIPLMSEYMDFRDEIRKIVMDKSKLCPHQSKEVVGLKERRPLICMVDNTDSASPQHNAKP